MHRRKLLQWGLGAIGAGLLPLTARAEDDLINALLEGKLPQAAQVPPPTSVAATVASIDPPPLKPAFATRWVHLQNVHTGEKLEAVYWENGDYVPDAVSALDKVLRDYRNDEVHPIDRGLYDLLDQIARKTESKGPFQVISGYRSPATNRLLAKRSGEVAKKSLHMDGKAMDVFLEDVELTHVRAAALDLGVGGVGYYPTSNFVHVDMGPVRKWTGT